MIPTRAATMLALILACACSGENEGSGPEGCCEASCYPASPQTVETLYVNPECASKSLDGSLRKPFHSVVDALIAADHGAAILVAAGDYVEASPIVIKKDVSLLGMGGFEPDTGVYIDRTYLVVEDVATLSVHGTSGVVVSGMTIEGSTIAGIDVHGAAGLTLTHNHVTSTVATADELFGHGIVVSDSNGVTIEENLIEGSAQIGVLVDESGVVLRGNHLTGNRQGIRVDDSPVVPAAADSAGVAPIEISDNAVISNFTAGINIVGSVAVVAGNRVEDTRPHSDDPDQVADGIVIWRSAEAGAPETRVWLGGTTKNDAQGNHVLGSHRCGVLISDGASVELMVGNQVSDNLFGGVWIQNGSAVKAMVANTIGRNAMAGVGLTAGAEAVIGSDNLDDFNLIFETAPIETIVNGETLTIGDGVGVFLGSKVTVQHNKILDNHRGGILLDDPDSTAVYVGNNRIDGGEYDIVVQAQEDQQVPAGQISGNFTNTMGADACAPPTCISPEPANQVENYGDVPRLNVMDDPILMPCIPPSCTD